MSVAEKLTEIAENVPRVFNVGYARGYDEGYAKGEEDGNVAGYDAGYAEGYNVPITGKDLFWYRYQDGGFRDDYDYAFSTRGYVSNQERFWNASEVKPKYPMYVKSAEHMFYGLQGELQELDLTQLGHELSFAGCKNFNHTFAKTKAIRHVGVIDASKATDVQRIFFECTGLETVDKLIVHEGLTWTGSFSGCVALKNITIQGKIGHRIQFHRSMSSLSKASITSIVNALSDTVTAEEIDGVVGKPSVYFSEKNIIKAFGSTTSSAWTTLVDSKPNWNFVLA